MNDPTYDDLLQRAQDARRTKRPEVHDLAAELRARSPKRPTGFQIGIAVARENGDLAAAADLLDQAATLFPDAPWMLAETGWVARARKDTAAATAAAARLRVVAPSHPAGYQLGIAVANDRRDVAAAKTLLAEAEVRLPPLPWLLVERIKWIRADGDLLSAARLATKLREHFPESPQGYRLGSQLARQSGRFDEAADILAEAITKFPDQSWLLADRAQIARAQGNFATALDLAADLRDRFPREHTGWQLAGSFLRNHNQLAEAEAMLRDAESLFPGEAWPTSQLAETVTQRVNRDRSLDIAVSLSGMPMPPSPTASPPQPHPLKIVIVLGMHRAGTSLCTRIVERLGFPLGGPLIPPQFDNLDGFQEHEGIVACHSDLMAAAGATWSTVRLAQPLPENFWAGAAAVAARARLRNIVTEQLAANGGIWAFKDPRTARTLPLWKDLLVELGLAPVWILAVRDPRAVAVSLNTRNGLPVAVGELLWLEHYVDALCHVGAELAHVVHYEDWFADPQAAVESFADVLNVRDPSLRAAASDVVRPILRHSQPDYASDTLPAARELHLALRTSHDGSTLRDYALSLQNAVVSALAS